MKHTHVDGAIIVVTPQDVALDDERKAAACSGGWKCPSWVLWRT